MKNNSIQIVSSQSATSYPCYRRQRHNFIPKLTGLLWLFPNRQSGSSCLFHRDNRL